MANLTVEELEKRAAEQAALAAEAKAKLDAANKTLDAQQSELKSLQQAIVDYGQAIQGKPAQEQQVIANAIVLLQAKIRTLNTAINSTNAKINTYATELANYDSNAQYYTQEAAALSAPQTPIPEPVTTTEPPEPIDELAYNTDFISGPYAPSRDAAGNLNPGWTVDDIEGDQYVGPDYVSPLSSGSFSSRPTTTVPYGPTRDDEGNLMPGYEEDELGGDIYVGPDYISASVQESASISRGLAINRAAARGAPSNQNATNQQSNADWRVKLSLADDQNYLYNLKPDPGILAPLAKTNGVIFPYVPSINVVYNANYDATDIAHSNYKIFSYRQSSIDSISITGDFTAQDTNEANYLLAVIHFFKSVTKMFYGKDQNPKRGTPPPLCYLTGLGAFQFDKHPLVITTFTYSLPTEVDYIRASYYTSDEPGVSQAFNNTPYTPSPREVRLPQYLKPGGVQGPPQWRTAFPTSLEPTYVPTKMQIQITALPIVTRNDISKRFSLADYAAGDFYRGSVGKTNGRGIW